MKKHKFNWIDGVVLAVIVLLIAGTCVKFLVLDAASRKKETKEFTYEMEIRGVRKFTMDALKVGDTVYDNTGKAEVGVISSIAEEPATVDIYYPNGTTSKGTEEDRYDLTLTLTATGTVEDSHYAVGTYDIMTNHSDTYYTKYAIWSATIGAIH